MLRVASDENIWGGFVRGLLGRNPAIDLVRVQDVGLRSEPDESILEWCAQENRVLISHDRNTMVAAAYARVRQGQPMPGVFLVDHLAPTSAIIDSLLLLIEDSADGEWKYNVVYVPI